MEQGGGKHSKNVIVIVSPKAKMSVRKQIAEEWGKTIKIDLLCEYKTSFPSYIIKPQNEYNQELKFLFKGQ